MNTPEQDLAQQARDKRIAGRKLAEQDLIDIAALRKVPGLERYLFRRIREEIARHEEMVLDSDSVTPAEREFARQRRLELKRLLKMIDQDEFHQQAVMRNP